MKLDVLMGECEAGGLEFDEADQKNAHFNYRKSYLEQPDPTPLSTLLPLTDDPIEGPGLENWLVGLLPEHPALIEGLLLQVTDWPSRDINPWEPSRIREQMSLLCTPMGSDCAGAVRFCRPERTDDLLAGRGGLDALSDDDVHHWLRNLCDSPSYRPDGHRFAGFALSGHQPKLALRLTPQGWAVPWGAEATSHILKPSRSQRFPHEALMQHLNMQTAAKLGLAVPDTWIIDGEDLEAIVVTRYDRAPGPTEGSLMRVHQEDLCQAMGVRPNHKFIPYFGTPLVASAAEVLRRAGEPLLGTLLGDFLDLLIFQWLTVHTDAHAKNFSLMLSGSQRAMAPLYDATSWLPYNPGPTDAIKLAMAVGGDRTLESEDQPSAVLRTADTLGLSRHDTAQRFQQLSAALPQALQQAAAALPVAHQNLPIIENYLTEQHQRAQRCHRIATQAADQATATTGQRRRRLDGQAIAESYRKMPQTDEEDLLAEQNAIAMVEQEPWWWRLRRLRAKHR